jgi:hypothetical protein
VTIEEDSLAFINTLKDTLQKTLLKCIQKCIHQKALESGEAPPPAITGQRKIFEKGELILIELEEAPEGPYSETNQPCGERSLLDLPLMSLGWTTASSILNPSQRLNSVFGKSMRRNAAGERTKGEEGVPEPIHIAAYWRSISFGLPSNAFLLQVTRHWLFLFLS